VAKALIVLVAKLKNHRHAAQARRKMNSATIPGSNWQSRAGASPIATQGAIAVAPVQ
jgi:hypothetical protein